MVDLQNMDGEPREVAAAALDNLEEAIKNFAAAVQETEHWVRNAALDEIIAVMGDTTPPDQLNEEWEKSAECEYVNSEKHLAVNALRFAKNIRAKTETYEGYGID